MSPRKRRVEWKVLDRDLNRFSRLEWALLHSARPMVGIGLSVLFLALAGIVAGVLFGRDSDAVVVVLAALLGGYMALNIGANDVANNMGPTVGAGALPMVWAIALAALCESAGALLAGGDVVTTISSGIVRQTGLVSPATHVWAMMAALMTAAAWVNLATFLGAPVSTTQAIVGGVLGAGVAAAGLGAVNWPLILAIAIGWVVAPTIGGALAALLLAFIEWRILRAPNRLAAARGWVPVLIAVMAGAFAAYLLQKGLGHVTRFTGEEALTGALLVGLAVLIVTIPLLQRQSAGLDDRGRSLKQLFRLPLILSAALLSFAHGANDVANAVGPVAAVVHTYLTAEVAGVVTVPQPVMVLGAFGISLGLILFGPRLIRLVGNEITRLNPLRAFCIALSSAVTVLAASGLGLPVSSTHIAVGGVFGVGFYREWSTARRDRRQARNALPERLPSGERRRRRLVRRSHFLTILAAWVITLPATACLSALAFLCLMRIPL